MSALRIKWKRANALNRSCWVRANAVGAAEQEFRRRHDVFAVDDAGKPHLGMAGEIVGDRRHHQRIAGVQHVVEADNAVPMQQRVDELEIVGQALARVVAVDVHKAQRPLALSFAPKSSVVIARLSAFHDK